MLWPLVLPFKITFWVFASLLGVSVIVAPLLKRKRSRVFLWGFPMALLAFVPSCSIVMSVIDKSRFGVFEYDALVDVQDERVERYLPPSARDITLDKYGQGYRARYQIEPDALEDWFDGMWNQFGEYSVVAKANPAIKTISPETFDLQFSGLGWPRPGEVTEYHGPFASNGAGFTIWYDAESGIAYERGHYF
ncbi:MAG: hypothetical protein ACR2NZ_19250 [Rubripirellula sp.]